MQPSRQFTARAALSTGFRAPGLTQSHFSRVNTNVIGGVVTDVLIVPVADSAARLFNSKPLQAEKSVNVSAGFAFSPNDNVTFTVDAFQIKINHRILLSATFADSVTQAILAANNFTNVSGLQYFTNGLDTRTRGLDITGTLRMNAGAGTFDWTAMANYTKTAITHLDPRPAVFNGTPSTVGGIIDSPKLGTGSRVSIWRSAFAICSTPIRTSRAPHGSWIPSTIPRRTSTTISARSPGPRRRRSVTTAAICTRARKCG
ncbi:MAG: hypothetical protein DMD59_03260 [Gemmatimonadetes bacterium]|nr:MAG: hypothetical protein DMD59_03260 [Gemmatimonadota bacterium]